MTVIDRARALRVSATPAERVLWQAMRSRLLGGKVRRQVPMGLYVLDFLFLAEGLVVEVDGDTHATPLGLRRDARRDAWLGAQGLRVLRISNREVFENLDGVLAVIVAALHHPHPGPLPPAGEGARPSDEEPGV